VDYQTTKGALPLLTHASCPGHKANHMQLNPIYLSIYLYIYIYILLLYNYVTTYIPLKVTNFEKPALCRCLS